MKRRRVKITGIGPVTPAGIGKEEFWKGISEPVSRVRPYTKLGDELGPFVAAYISSFDIGRFIEDRSVLPKGLSRQSSFAIAAALLALQDAGISGDEFRDADAAIVAGSSLMDFGGIVGSIDAVQKKGVRAAQARSLYATGISSTPSAINQALRSSSRTMAVSTQCCAGMDAVGCAVDLIANGEADIVLCGGSEAPLHRFPIVEFRMGELTPATTELPHRMSRPFDLWRTTGVVSEGACMFVLEPEQSPRKGYGLVAGYAFGNDDQRLCDGMEISGRLATASAGIKLSDIDAINAWGPGHKLVDAGEARALRAIFGERLEEIPAVSIKGAIGMPLGAAPAIQMAAALLSQSHGVVLPTVNWDYPDPDCPLQLSRELRYCEHYVTLLNAHGVGGVNASMVLHKC